MDNNAVVIVKKYVNAVAEAFPKGSLCVPASLTNDGEYRPGYKTNWTIAGGFMTYIHGITTKCTDVDFFLNEDTDDDRLVKELLQMPDVWKMKPISTPMYTFDFNPTSDMGIRIAASLRSAGFPNMFPQVIVIRKTHQDSEDQHESLMKKIDVFDLPLCRRGLIVNKDDCMEYNNTGGPYSWDRIRYFGRVLKYIDRLSKFDASDYELTRTYNGLYRLVWEYNAKCASTGIESHSVGMYNFDRATHNKLISDKGYNFNRVESSTNETYNFEIQDSPSKDSLKIARNHWNLEFAKKNHQNNYNFSKISHPYVFDVADTRIVIENDVTETQV